MTSIPARPGRAVPAGAAAPTGRSAARRPRAGLRRPPRARRPAVAPLGRGVVGGLVTRWRGGWPPAAQTPPCGRGPPAPPDHPSTTLTGHDAGVRTVAWAPDGRRLASGSDDGTARVWDPDDPGRPAVLLTGHAGSVWSVAWSPDGRWLATADSDGTLRVWDPDAPARPRLCSPATSAAPGRSPGHRTGAGWPLGVPIGPFGCGTSPTVPGRPAAPVVLAAHDGWVWSVAWSPDGRSDRLGRGSHRPHLAGGRWRAGGADRPRRPGVVGGLVARRAAVGLRRGRSDRTGLGPRRSVRRGRGRAGRPRGLRVVGGLVAGRPAAGLGRAGRDGTGVEPGRRSPSPGRAWSITVAGCGRWTGRRTGGGWPPEPRTVPCGCGTPTSRIRPGVEMAGARQRRLGRGVVARRATAGRRRRRPDRADLGHACRGRRRHVLLTGHRRPGALRGVGARRAAPGHLRRRRHRTDLGSRPRPPGPDRADRPPGVGTVRGLVGRRPPAGRGRRRRHGTGVGPRTHPARVPVVVGGDLGRVASVAWSPDGRLLAVGAGDGTVGIWDAQRLGSARIRTTTDRPTRRPCSRPTPKPSCRSPGRRTAGGWPLRARTGRCGSGTPAATPVCGVGVGNAVFAIAWRGDRIAVGMSTLWAVLTVDEPRGPARSMP